MCGRWAKRLAARDREVAKLNLPVEVRWWDDDDEGCEEFTGGKASNQEGQKGSSMNKRI